MTKQLLRHIAFMCLFLMLGALNWITVAFTSKMWLCVLSFVSTISAFYIAYICYCRARKIAEAIDTHKVSISRELILHYELIKYSIYGEESESNGQEQAEEPVQSGADREDESEDNHAYPI